MSSRGSETALVIEDEFIPKQKGKMEKILSQLRKNQERNH